MSEGGSAKGAPSRAPYIIRLVDRIRSARIAKSYLATTTDI